MTEPYIEPRRQIGEHLFIDLGGSYIVLLHEVDGRVLNRIKLSLHELQKLHAVIESLNCVSVHQVEDAVKKLGP